MPAPAAKESPASAPPSRRPTLLAAGLIVLAVVAAYQNALSTPFVFDDQFAVVDNPTIRHLGQLGDVLRPPPFASGAAGRPLVNLTLALNYAFGGLQPWGYHALNLILHALTALVLFGLLRRTLLRQSAGGGQGLARPPASDGAQALDLAFFTALLWAVHPLLTESVTGVIQRNEILAGLCYLLTLYAFARGTESAAAERIWLPLAILICALGMAAKEIMVSAPLAVLLYDRTFVARTFAAAWRVRRGFYLGLASTWLLLAALMLTSQQRGGTVGFGLGVSAWDYLLTQCHALVTYAKLSLWPNPLVIDYGTDLVTQVDAIALPGLAILAAVAAVVACVVRGAAFGFLGACFFAILAPSSSFVPLVTQPIAEHRMYLPLVAIVALATVGLFRVFERRRAIVVCAALALGLGALTARRNADYRSETTLTQSALAANPRNDRAYLNLGTFASREGRIADAIGYYEKALALKPAEADTHFNLAAVLEQAGRSEEAITHYQEAVRLRTDLPSAHYQLGLALAKNGRVDAAILPLAEAVRLQPTSASARAALASAHVTLGNAAAKAGRLPDAIAHYESALQAHPSDAQAHNNLANAFSQTNRPAEAILHYEDAVREAPDYAEAHFNLASELANAGRLKEARAHFAEVLRLKPGDAQARQAIAQIDAAAH